MIYRDLKSPDSQRVILPIPGPADRLTLQGFAAYQTDKLRWSVLYSNQVRQDDPPLELASARHSLHA